MAGGAGKLQRLLEVVGGLLVPALHPVDVAEAGQRGQLGVAVAGGAGELQRLPEVVGGLFEPALQNGGRRPRPFSALQLAGSVAGGAGELQRLLVVVGGLAVPTLHPMDVAEAGQRVELAARLPVERASCSACW